MERARVCFLRPRMARTGEVCRAATRQAATARGRVNVLSALRVQRANMRRRMVGSAVAQRSESVAKSRHAAT
jgi:hypothetical protein